MERLAGTPWQCAEKHSHVSKAMSSPRCARLRAEQTEQIARRHWRGSQIKLAQQAWEAGHVELAQELLANVRHEPEPAERPGFGVVYLRRLCHREFSLLLEPHRLGLQSCPHRRWPHARFVRPGGERPPLESAFTAALEPARSERNGRRTD